jgi:hypothetical protein
MSLRLQYLGVSLEAVHEIKGEDNTFLILHILSQSQ